MRFRGRKLTIDDLLKQDKPHPLQEVVDYTVKKEDIKSAIKHLLPMLHIEQVNELHYLITKLQWEVRHREELK